MNPRRQFLNQLTLIAGATALSKPLSSAAAVTKRINTLGSAASAVTVYHTANVNGKIGTALKNTGGLAQIGMTLKNQETGGLLLDAGNFINKSGSLSHQKEVIYMMNRMGYHTVAIGNHELSQGEDHLAALIPLMQFTPVNCNLQFSSKLNKLVKPYAIINSGKFKVGITGVCHQIKGIKYNDAIESANRMAQLLKNEQKCDLVICLSNLGHNHDGDKPDNQKLAAQTQNIDLIIGGQSTQLSSNTFVLRNKLKQEVVLTQTAHSGLTMGKTVIALDSNKGKNGFSTKHFIPGQASNQPFTASFAALKQAESKFLQV